LYYLNLQWVAAENTSWDIANKERRFLILENKSQTSQIGADGMLFNLCFRG
jgi:hypothetical protein